MPIPNNVHVQWGYCVSGILRGIIFLCCGGADTKKTVAWVSSVDLGPARVLTE
ncbi:hypothetical protein HMPREF0294_2523 [Corynebacterium glucuronolyticum ATCC 51867]|nr:hypothetical protein HMPREF0294_2523 [Corynebacterium glucuronolyticum ATCC 51867]